VVEICRSVDGLPLAIELAAARTRVLPPHELLEQLASRLRTLVGGARDLPARQQTLRATIDWSIDLLSTEQRQLFQKLGVFVGSWSLDATRVVCESDAVSQGEIIDSLEALVDHSLLQQLGLSEDRARFSMLETIREYAAEQLAKSGEAEWVRSR